MKCKPGSHRLAVSTLGLLFGAFAHGSCSLDALHDTETHRQHAITLTFLRRDCVFKIYENT